MLKDTQSRMAGLISKLQKIQTSNEEEMRDAIETLRNLLIIALRETVTLELEIRSVRRELVDDAHS